MVKLLELDTIKNLLYLMPLIERGDQEYPDDDILGVNFNRSLDFKFFRDDLVEQM